jgi:ERCC4-related helicase
MDLVALLSSDNGSWSQVSGLIKHGEWENIIVLGNDYAKKFSVSEKKFDFIKVDLSKKLKDLKSEFLTVLKPKINDTEVALTIASGSGKEHMALISALLSVPTGIRFTALTKEGIIFL